MDGSAELVPASSGPDPEEEEVGCEKYKATSNMTTLLSGQSSGHEKEQGQVTLHDGHGDSLYATKPPPSPLHRVAPPAGFRDSTLIEGVLSSSLDVKRPATTESSSTTSIGSATLQPGDHGGHQPPYQTTSGGGIGFMSSLNAEALEAFDLPGYVKRHSATLTFPEKLMMMLAHVEKVYAKGGKRIDSAPVEWVQDGMVVFIRDKNKLARDWMPLFFNEAKFSSFTRKLYRWGFRQYSSPGEVASKPPASMYFFNENFQRNDHSLLSRMRSVTAAGTRREEAQANKRRKEVAITTTQPPSLSSDPLVRLLQPSTTVDLIARLLLLQASTVLPLLAAQPNDLQQAPALNLTAVSPPTAQTSTSATSSQPDAASVILLRQLLGQNPQPSRSQQEPTLHQILSAHPDHNRQGSADPSTTQLQSMVSLFNEQDRRVSVNSTVNPLAVLAMLQQQLAESPPPPPPPPPALSSLITSISQAQTLEAASSTASLQDSLARALLLHRLQSSQQVHGQAQPQSEEAASEDERLHSAGSLHDSLARRSLLLQQLQSSRQTHSQAQPQPHREEALRTGEEQASRLGAVMGLLRHQNQGSEPPLPPQPRRNTPPRSRPDDDAPSDDGGG